MDPAGRQVDWPVKTDITSKNDYNEKLPPNYLSLKLADTSSDEKPVRVLS